MVQSKILEVRKMNSVQLLESCLKRHSVDWFKLLTNAFQFSFGSLISEIKETPKDECS